MEPLDASSVIETVPLGPPGPQGEPGPRGVPGPQGIQGFPGLIGPQGLSTYSGNTTPDSSFGRDGETFIVPNEGKIFRKTAGNWNQVGSLIGPRGPIPAHEINGFRIRFQNGDGTFGDYIDFGTVALDADRAEEAANFSESNARAAAASAQSVDGPAINARIDRNLRFSAAYALTFGRL